MTELDRIAKNPAHARARPPRFQFRAACAAPVPIDDGQGLDETEPFFRVWLRNPPSDWQMRADFRGFYIAAHASQEEAWAAARAVHDRFLARRGASGIAPQFNTSGDRMHAGTVAEDDPDWGMRVRVCDHCHRWAGEA